MQNKINRGVLPPLFERIMDPPTAGLLDTAGLKESIMRELSRNLTVKDLEESDANKREEWPTIAKHLEIAIQSIEPRLDKIRVKIDTYDPTYQALDITVHGIMSNTSLSQEIQFPLTLTV